MIDINLTTSNGDVHLLTIDDPCYFLDHVVEIGRIGVYNGDTLTITWDLKLQAYTNEVLTDEKPIKFKETFVFDEYKVLRFIRLIRKIDKVKIKVYEFEPTDLIDLETIK